MSQLNVSAIKNVLGTGSGIDLFNSGNFSFATDKLFVDAVNGRLGVGTTTPEVALHILGTGGFKLETAPLIEGVNIVGGTINGNTTVDLDQSSVHLFTSSGTGNWTTNLRVNSSTTLDSKLSVGEVITVILISQLGGSSGYTTSLNIDGTGQTVEWSDGDAPSERGGTSGYDLYQFTIIRTSTSSTGYLVLGNKAYFS